MAKDYWGSGPKSLLPRNTGDAPAVTPSPVNPATAKAPTPRQPARSLTRDMPQSVTRQRGTVALDETRAKPKSEAATMGETTGLSGRALPDLMRTVSFGRKVWFAVSFLIPMILGALYVFFIAPDEYITEYRFSVRVPVGQQGSLASGGASLSALFGGNPTPGSDLLDNYTVADYVSSAQAARDLDTKVGLRTMYNKPLDPFSRIGAAANSERLGRYWHSMVYSSYDVATGLAVVRVKAYSAPDSFAIANSLVELSSDLVNSIGTRSQQDSVRFAQSQLERAKTQVDALSAELANLRRQNNVIDPVKGAVAGNIDLVNELTNRRAQLQAQSEMMMQQLHNAEAPQVQLLQQQIGAVNHQITQARASGGAAASGANIAVTMGQFEKLADKLKNAQSVQAAATQALNNAQTSAEAQRLYLTTYVRPVQPESPEGPKRWLDLLLIGLVASMVWVIGRLIGNSIMEHA